MNDHIEELMEEKKTHSENDLWGHCIGGFIVGFVVTMIGAFIVGFIVAMILL